MITINGKKFTGNFSGQSLTISNNKVYIDGKEIDNEDAKEIKIEIIGNVETLDIDCCDSIKITGNCHDVESTNGNIEIGGDVTNNIKSTNGNIKCKNVGGCVKTTNGNIKHS